MARPYWTLAKIQTHINSDALAQLVDDEGDGIVENPENDAYGRIVAAGTCADNLVDGELRGSYTVPFDTVPDIIAEVSSSLAAFNLYGLADPDSAVPERITEAKRDAMRILEHVRDGKISLMDSDQNVASGVQVNKTAADRLFTNDVLSTF